MRYSFTVILEGCASAGALLGLGWLLGQGAALRKLGRELKGVMYAGTPLGACKAAGQKARRCKPRRPKEEGRFLASLPLSSCCSQRSRSSARTPPRHPPPPKGPFGPGSVALGAKAWRSSGSAARPSSAQQETPRSCRTRNRRGSGQLARRPRDKKRLSRWSWTCCWELLGCRPKLPFPSELTSAVVHPL